MGRKRRRRRKQPPGRALAPRAAPPGQGDGGPRSVMVLSQRAAGVRVTEDTALTLGAVYACVRVIAEGLGVLPWPVFERRGACRFPVSDDPAEWLLDTEANPETSAFTWREITIAHALLWGNGYSEIERDAAGRPLWLWQLTPERVTVERGGGAVVYRVRNPQREDTILPAADVFHLRGLGWDGLQGYPVVRLAARTIGLGIALDEATASHLGNDSTPGGFLKHPGRLTDKAKQNLRESWQRRYGGPSNRRTLAVLEEGLDFQQVGIPPEDLQLFEQRRYTPAEVCRWFRVQPHKIADLERATFSNIEEQNIEHDTDTLDPWARRLDAEANRKLFGRNTRGRRFASLGLKGKLRGNAASRVAFYLPLLDRGVFSINEVREMEDRNPIEGGDLRMVQQNMMPLERATAPPPAADGTPTAAPAEQDELVDVPDRRQAKAWSCGAAACWAVGDCFEAGPGTEEGWIELCGTTAAAGTTPGGLVAALVGEGLAVASEAGMDLDDLGGHCSAGRPVICLVQGLDGPPGGYSGGHYLVVLGVGLGQVFVQDPVSGRGMVPEADFLARWHDREADGQVTQRWGAAAGLDLDGPEESEVRSQRSGVTTPGPAEPDEDEDNPGSELAMLPVLAEALGRCERRAAHRLQDARKRLKGEAAVAAWLGETAAERRAYALETLTPGVLALGRPPQATLALAAFLDAGGTDAADLARRVLAACPRRSAAVPRRIEVMRVEFDDQGRACGLTKEMRRVPALGWNEEDHPRAPDGKFGEGGGGSSRGDGKSGGGGKSEHHDRAVADFKGAAEKSGLPKDQQERYTAAAREVIGKMAPGAAERFNAGVSGYEFHASGKALTDAVAKVSLKVAVAAGEGQTIGGAYFGKTGVLALDGRFDASTTSGSLDTAPVYAHEFGHAIDGRAGARISDKPEWQAAWQEELKFGAPLSAYAATSAVEGFAEFSRLIHSVPGGLKQAQRKFPECVAVWKKEKLL